MPCRPSAKLEHIRLASLNYGLFDKSSERKIFLQHVCIHAGNLFIVSSNAIVSLIGTSFYNKYEFQDVSCSIHMCRKIVNNVLQSRKLSQCFPFNFLMDPAGSSEHRTTSICLSPICGLLQGLHISL